MHRSEQNTRPMTPAEHGHGCIPNVPIGDAA